MDMLPTGEEDLSRIRARRALRGELAICDLLCGVLELILGRFDSLARRSNRLWCAKTQAIDLTNLKKNMQNISQTSIIQC